MRRTVKLTAVPTLSLILLKLFFPILYDTLIRDSGFLSNGYKVLRSVLSVKRLFSFDYLLPDTNCIYTLGRFGLMHKRSLDISQKIASKKTGTNLAVGVIVIAVRRFIIQKVDRVMF